MASIEGAVCGYNDARCVPAVRTYCQTVPHTLFRAFCARKVSITCTVCDNKCAATGRHFRGYWFAECVLESMRTKKFPPPPLDALPTAVVADVVFRWPLWLGPAAAATLEKRADPLPVTVAHKLVCAGVGTWPLTLEPKVHPRDAGKLWAVRQWARWLAGHSPCREHAVLLVRALMNSTPLPEDLAFYIVKLA